MMWPLLLLASGHLLLRQTAAQGKCCRPDGSCEDGLENSQCISPKDASLTAPGLWAPGQCSPGACDRGACCDGGLAGCFDNTIRDKCWVEGVSGPRLLPFIAGKSCEEGCYSLHRGACCFRGSVKGEVACKENTTQRNCSMIPYKDQIGFSSNKTCAQARCRTMYGACCFADFWMPQPHKWQCYAGLTKASCVGKGSPQANFFWAAGTSCGSNEQNSGLKVCGSFTGACCSISAKTGRATCADNLSRSACTSRRGKFSYGKKCKDVPCTTGACCIQFDNNQISYEDFCSNSTDETSCGELAVAQGPQAVGHFTAQAHCGTVNCWDMRGACCKQGASGRPTCSMATHRRPTPFDNSCTEADLTGFIGFALGRNCSEVQCRSSIGACCQADDIAQGLGYTCKDSMTKEACNMRQAAQPWLLTTFAPGKPCSACGQAVTGACCTKGTNPGSISCAEKVPVGVCKNSAGYLHFSAGKSCKQAGCSGIGICCFVDNMPRCYDAWNKSACESPSAYFPGETCGADVLSTPCPSLLKGSCCLSNSTFGSQPTCQDNISMSDCTSNPNYLNFRSSVACNELDCRGYGACCATVGSGCQGGVQADNCQVDLYNQNVWLIYQSCAACDTAPVTGACCFWDRSSSVPFAKGCRDNTSLGACRADVDSISFFSYATCNLAPC